MKPKWKHYIPIIGLGMYFKDYFDADKRDAKEALFAHRFMMVHIIVMCMIIIVVSKIALS